MLRTQGFETIFRPSISGNDLEIVGYVFVDDDDCISAAPYDDMGNSEYVAARMQEILDTWHGGIKATGGALVPEKSFWFPIGFKWNGDKWTYKKAEDFPAKLKIDGLDGNPVTLRKFEPSHGERTLGVRTGPNGNWKEQVAYMKEASWAEKTRVGHLPRHLIWKSMTTTIFKTLEYPATDFLSQDECKAITSPLLAVGPSKSGIVRTIPVISNLATTGH